MAEGAIVELVDCDLSGMGGTQSYGISNNGAGSTLIATNSDANGILSDFSVGLHNTESASANLDGGSFKGSGPGNEARGILNEKDATLNAKYIFAAGRYGDDNEGIRISNAYAEILHSVIAGSTNSLNTIGQDAELYASFTNLEDKGSYDAGTDNCTAMVYDNSFFVIGCP
jgi:hypothetical protein